MADADLKIGGLSISISRRTYPDATDYWDGNWLYIMARCEYPGARVTAEGTILHLGELSKFHESLKALNSTLSGSAELECIEPNLHVSLTSKTLGHLELTIELTPEHLTQSHRFVHEIDQSYLTPIIADCARILERYPLRSGEN